MNFEFIKDLDSLGRVYGTCKRAEELAVFYPDESLNASRKSGEMLAGLCYMQAHAQKAMELTFFNMLQDPVVRDYLNNPMVISAFHAVRKGGNSGSHATEEEQSSREAISVLENLHFVVGEVAKRLGLILSYPTFNEHIPAQLVRIPSAEDADMDVAAVALAMYEDYAASRRRADRLFEEFLAFCSPYKVAIGSEELCETIEFQAKPRSEGIIKKIQEHFGALAMRRLRHELKEDQRFSATLTLHGEHGYTTSDVVRFVSGLFIDLPKAEGFRIESSYFGPYLDPETGKQIEDELQNALRQSTESCDYASYEYFYDSGDGHVCCYRDGRWLREEDLYAPAVIDQTYEEWWCHAMEVSVELDSEKHPDVVAALHDAVRRHVPADQLEECEQAWEDDETNRLAPGIQWSPQRLRDIQDFLDEVNRIIKPIQAECECFGEGSWFMDRPPFADARLVWTESGFQIFPYSTGR